MKIAIEVFGTQSESRHRGVGLGELLFDLALLAQQHLRLEDVDLSRHRFGHGVAERFFPTGHASVYGNSEQKRQELPAIGGNIL